MACELQLSGSGDGVLRISMSGTASELVTLHLEGQVSGPWVELLEKICEAHLKRGDRFVINLRNVSFADRDGVTLLRNLAERQVEIVNALPFIAEQIRKAPPC
jgi:ABC-type transporter Mla MlaB component